MKRAVINMVMTAVGVAAFALAPAAFAGDKHRIPLPHEVLGIPAPHEVILGIHGHRGHSSHNYRNDYRDDHRHGHRNNGHHYGHHKRHDWRDDRHRHYGRYDHDRRSDYRDSRSRHGRHRH